MSTTTVKVLKYPLGVVDSIEFRNSHGSAPVVWDLMAQKYLKLPPFNYMFNTDKLWPLWKRKDIPESHRAVLGMTYDNAVIAKKDFGRAAKDLRFFLNDFYFNPEHENHWPAILNILESELDCDAIGFHWTSVTEDPFLSDFDEDLDEYKTFDYSKFWSLYDSLISYSEK